MTLTERLTLKDKFRFMFGAIEAKRRSGRIIQMQHKLFPTKKSVTEIIRKAAIAN